MPPARQPLHAPDRGDRRADRIDQGPEHWRPENYSTEISTGRRPLARPWSCPPNQRALARTSACRSSPNTLKRFGIYDDLPNYLSYALGAGETTVMRMVTAYSMFANGGKRIKPTLIDRIQDRYGHTIYKHDQRECRGCDASDGWKNQPEPTLVDRRDRCSIR